MPDNTTPAAPQPSMAPPPPVESKTAPAPAQPQTSQQPAAPSSPAPVRKSQSANMPKVKMDLGSKFFWLVIALVGASLFAIIALIVSIRFTS